MIDFHWITITNMGMVRLYMVIITTVNSVKEDRWYLDSIQVYPEYGSHD